MKLCLMILSVPWYMFNGLEYTAILNHFLTFITGSSSRLQRIRFSADLAMYWCPVCHFRCKEFNPLVVWIWNQNIAIYTIVGTSSHIIIKTSNQNTCISFNEAARAAADDAAVLDLPSVTSNAILGMVAISENVLTKR